MLEFRKRDDVFEHTVKLENHVITELSPSFVCPVLFITFLFCIILK